MANTTSPVVLDSTGKALNNKLDSIVEAITNNKIVVEDNVTSTSTVNVLSANQGRILNEKIDNLPTDQYISDVSSDFEVTDKKLNLSNTVSDKLSSLDKVDLTSAASDDEVLAWDSTQNKYTPKVAKGGHDMLDSVSDVESLTDGSGNKVANAYVIKQYSNRYTNSVISTLSANNNEITIENDVFKDDNATFEFMFEPTQNASGTYEYLTLARYELDTTNGTIKITVVDAPTVDTRIRVDVTNYRA